MCWLWECLGCIPAPALPTDPKDLPVGFLSLVIVRGLLVVRDGLGTETWDQKSRDEAPQGAAPTCRERDGIQRSGAEEGNPCLENHPQTPPGFILQNSSRRSAAGFLPREPGNGNEGITADVGTQSDRKWLHDVPKVLFQWEHRSIRPETHQNVGNAPWKPPGWENRQRLGNAPCWENH